jgi:hypothetical protein
MKSWFPLTDYEFYAFLSAGMIVIAAVDLAFGGSTLTARSSWTVAAGVFWIVIAYLIGQLLAGPSSSFLEHLVGRRFFHPPGEVLLGFATPRWREKLLCAVAGAHEYQPFAPTLATSIKDKAATLLGGVVPADAETVFQIAFPKARTSADTAKRLDTFSNVYGMCRNVSFAACIAAAVLATAAIRHCDVQAGWYAAGAVVLAAGMFGRFMKFYAAYSREVLRTFHSVQT